MVQCKVEEVWEDQETMVGGGGVWPEKNGHERLKKQRERQERVGENYQEDQ